MSKTRGSPPCKSKAAKAQVPRKIHREINIGSITVRVVEVPTQISKTVRRLRRLVTLPSFTKINYAYLLSQADISFVGTDAIVNAAHASSFKPMDNGVSGALRRACAPAKVTDLPKRWWDDQGVEHNDKKLAKKLKLNSKNFRASLTNKTT